MECKKHLTASKTYLSEKQDDYVYHDKWLLYAPKDLKQLVDKGVNDYDAI